MKKTVLAIVVALVVLVGAGGAVWALSGDDETSATGTCGGATYDMSAENDDNGLEVTFELQSAAPAETWNVVVEQDGVSVLEGDRQTDEDAELDVDVTVNEDDGTSFTVTATPENGDPCVATLDR
ncbi:MULTISPECIES: hypothetical protein [unclassified Nocardioides]|uniref:hypothetical protein n=1 Tax=unclassified Nocardioides TaxID=2615069 RepID=UPI0009EFA38F|nr:MULTISPECIES: hypothetical protein [unclassified Nocardioides]GAW50855.1 hypothetical protein PD653B2_3191 [Nocardioides sp. PD653-B2]GAW54013.1 hypothetical protein PD653_1420 [Nocardioides sp. PD653]